MTETVQVIRIFVDSALFVLIWLVQLIIYPAFHAIESGLFPVWHRNYMKTISLFVIPLMLLQVVCIGLQLRERLDATTIAAGGTVLAAWVITFAISAPCHQRLQRDGASDAEIDRLISTNRLRTACWSIAWLLGILRAFRCA